MRRLVMLVLVAGCTATDAEWSGSVETLPNGAVRVMNPAEGIWTAETAWRLEPELAIGEVEGAEALVFGSISALEVDAAGRIYVLDRQANELRIFSPEGAHVRTVGRSGEGPGEYSAANGLVWLAPDSLVVVDQRGARYSILSRDGDYVRSVVRRLGFYGWVFEGGLVGDRIYEQTVAGREDDMRPVLLGTALRGDVALETGTPSAAADGFTRAVVDTVGLPRAEGPLFESFSIRTERGGMVMSVPFAPTSVWHIAGDGEVWHGRGHEFRIARSTFAGDTTLEILLDATPAPVTAEELAVWEQGDGVRRFRDLGGNLDMSRIPDTKPFFDGFALDSRGNLWVTVPGPPYTTIFAVFDPDGRYLGRLQVDGVARDSYLSPVIRNGRLHVVGRDELDVQRVYVFRVEQ